MEQGCPNESVKIVGLHAAVAQWIEYWPPKPRVVGSIPASRATLMFFAIILFKTAFDDSVFRG